MPDYRLFCLDAQNRITNSHDLQAADDEAAIAHIQGHYAGFDCELWERGRRIAILPAQGAPVLLDFISRN